MPLLGPPSVRKFIGVPFNQRTALVVWSPAKVEKPAIQCGLLMLIAALDDPPVVPRLVTVYPLRVCAASHPDIKRQVNPTTITLRIFHFMCSPSRFPYSLPNTSEIFVTRSIARPLPRSGRAPSRAQLRTRRSSTLDVCGLALRLSWTFSDVIS